MPESPRRYKHKHLHNPHRPSSSTRKPGPFSQTLPSPILRPDLQSLQTQARPPRPDNPPKHRPTRQNRDSRFRGRTRPHSRPSLHRDSRDIPRARRKPRRASHPRDKPLPPGAQSGLHHLPRSGQRRGIRRRHWSPGRREPGSDPRTAIVRHHGSAGFNGGLRDQLREST